MFSQIGLYYKFSIAKVESEMQEENLKQGRQRTLDFFFLFKRKPIRLIFFFSDI